MAYDNKFGCRETPYAVTAKLWRRICHAYFALRNPKVIYVCVLTSMPASFDLGLHFWYPHFDGCVWQGEFHSGYCDTCPWSGWGGRSHGYLRCCRFRGMCFPNCYHVFFIYADLANEQNHLVSANCYVIVLSAHALVARVFVTYVIAVYFCFCSKVHSAWQTVLIMCPVTNVVTDFTVSRPSRLFF